MGEKFWGKFAGGKLQLDFLVINDSISVDTLEKLKKLTVFDKDKVLVIVDQIVPANDSNVSKLHLELRNLALKNGFKYIYGNEHTIVKLLNIVKEGDVVASCINSVVGVGACSAIGIKISEESLLEVYESGILSFERKPEKLLKFNFKGEADNRLKNINVLSAMKNLSEDFIYLINRSNFETYSSLDFAELVILAKKLGFDSFVVDNFEGECIEFDITLEEMFIAGGDYQNIVKFDEMKCQRVDVVFLGGPIGGSIENIRAFVERLGDKSIAYKVRLVVSPNSKESYIKACDEGLIARLLDKGAIVLNTCADPDIQARIGRNEKMLSLDLKTGKNYAGLEGSEVILSSLKLAVESVSNGYVTEGEAKAVDTDEVVKNIEGKVWLFGDDIDTDIIIPTQYVTLPMKEMINYAFEPLGLDLAHKIKPGDIIVASDNFGAGSSREMAAEVIAALGIKVIIAGSFARIFFRNAINNGVLLIENEELHKHVKEGDTVNVVINEYIEHKGNRYPIGKVQDNLLRIIYDGGLVKSIEKRVKEGRL